jgi:amino acid transporter
MRHVTTASPLEASSADLGGGRTAPALVVADYKVPSPLFALAPGLLALYGVAPVALVFVLGLLQAQWTYTGYDASAHVAEETVMARLNSAWGVFLSVAVSAVVGYALLLVLTWSIPKGDVAATANDAYPVLQIAYGNLPPALGHVIAVIIGVAMWLCGLASITSMGRMWYAFARDDGMPGARYLSACTPGCAPRCGRSSSPAPWYSVVTSISTVTLYLAYVIPIWLNWRNRRRRTGEYATRATAPWSLGRFGPAINAVAILWVIVISVVFALPPNELVLWTMFLLGGLIALYWTLSARRRFVGPAAGQGP